MAVTVRKVLFETENRAQVKHATIYSFSFCLKSKFQAIIALNQYSYGHTVEKTRQVFYKCED